MCEAHENDYALCAGKQKDNVFVLETQHARLCVLEAHTNHALCVIKTSEEYVLCWTASKEHDLFIGSAQETLFLLEAYMKHTLSIGISHNACEGHNAPDIPPWRLILYIFIFSYTRSHLQLLTLGWARARPIGIGHDGPQGLIQALGCGLYDNL